MGKRELVALLSLSSWYLVIAVWLFLAVPRGFLQFVIVVFPDHTHYFSWIHIKRIVFVCFDSLRPINNLSVKKGRVLLG